MCIAAFLGGAIAAIVVLALIVAGAFFLMAKVSDVLADVDRQGWS